MNKGRMRLIFYHFSKDISPIGQFSSPFLLNQYFEKWIFEIFWTRFETNLFVLLALASWFSFYHLSSGNCLAFSILILGLEKPFLYFFNQVRWSLLMFKPYFQYLKQLTEKFEQSRIKMTHFRVKTGGLRGGSHRNDWKWKMACLSPPFYEF